jgi:hypothetical protein
LLQFNEPFQRRAQFSGKKVQKVVKKVVNHFSNSFLFFLFFSLRVQFQRELGEFCCFKSKSHDRSQPDLKSKKKRKKVRKNEKENCLKRHKK